jgi:protein-disulfide isomerase
MQLNETLRANYSGNIITQEQVDEFVKKFNDADVENIILPESRIVFGNPNAKLTINVFTDFLCSACHNFFKTEKRILKKYYNEVKFVYYHYPLDMDCNKYASKSMYPNSCIASDQIEAAATINILSDYLDVHFSKYKDFTGSYSQEWAEKILEETAKNINWNEDNIKLFNGFVNSVKASKIVENNIEFAALYKINVTPTLFINGKRVLGGPKYPMMEAIINQELGKIHSK